jgi:hypothetical protein
LATVERWQDEWSVPRVFPAGWLGKMFFSRDDGSAAEMAMRDEVVSIPARTVWWDGETNAHEGRPGAGDSAVKVVEDPGRCLWSSRDGRV